MANTDKDGMLPPGQPCIQTSTLQSFVGMAKFLADTQHMNAMIGIAVGAPGIGKSIGICSYQLEELIQEAASPFDTAYSDTRHAYDYESTSERTETTDHKGAMV